MKKTNLSKPKTETTKAPSFSPEQAKWLTEGLQFNQVMMRYYALINNELPSIDNIPQHSIEAVALLHELKETLGAKVVYTLMQDMVNTTPHMQSYILSFPHPGYLLQANSIAAHPKSDYSVPDYVNLHSPHQFIYLSAFQLCRPGDDSGKRDMEFEGKLHHLMSTHLMHKAAEKPFIYMIEAGSDGWEINSHALVDDFEIEDLDINYGSGFTDFHHDLMDRFDEETKGLALFHGEPGTGKTYYIRHLLREMADADKAVIYMPPNMVDHLTEPGFMGFLMKQLTEWADEGTYTVLLIEDAEPLLAKRQEGIRIQGVTNLLNMTDGLLNDMLNLQIICTFNVDLKKLDSALLRPGRLIARKEFKALSVIDTNRLAQRLGIKHHFKKPATLGEIYSMLAGKHTLIHDVESDKGASTNIDDL
ncbi:MAG: AAA family ATPase [Bacteroidia bacterium]